MPELVSLLSILIHNRLILVAQGFLRRIEAKDVYFESIRIRITGFSAFSAALCTDLNEGIGAFLTSVSQIGASLTLCFGIWLERQGT